MKGLRGPYYVLMPWFKEQSKELAHAADKDVNGKKGLKDKL